DRRLLPPVELVSSLESSGVLHPQTLEALGAVGDRGEKAIVLLNRRGWSNFLSCRSCGRVWQCRQCDVALVLHRASGRIACHHCGHSEVVPPACPDCGSVSLARHGAGTERLEDELTRLLAPLPVFRLDADSASDRGAIPALLRRFASAAAGLLVGTQMVAKGHDFPDVTLAVVLDADATLRFPDFRAEERTFALVSQLAGRSGRGPRGGRVIVQCLDPDVRALRYAAAHDSDGFIAGELERRRGRRRRDDPPRAEGRARAGQGDDEEPARGGGRGRRTRGGGGRRRGGRRGGGGGGGPRVGPGGGARGGAGVPSSPPTGAPPL